MVWIFTEEGGEVRGIVYEKGWEGGVGGTELTVSSSELLERMLRRREL